MNSLHRAEIEKKLGVPVKEWQKRHKAVAIPVAV
jgi:hypothetical protein